MINIIHMYSRTADLTKLQESSRRKQCVGAVKSSLALGPTNIVTPVKSNFALKKMFQYSSMLVPLLKCTWQLLATLQRVPAEQRKRDIKRQFGGTDERRCT